MNNFSTKPFVIAIDGPAGAGKGTISKLICQKMGFHYLDSGAIYRIISFEAKRRLLTTNQISKIIEVIDDFNIQFIDEKIFLNNEDITNFIRSEEVGKLASEIAKNEQIRKKILDLQKSFFKSPGLVADGRDMGTVVFPDAKIKIFLTASIKERARRRYKQLILKENNVNLDDLFNSIKIRDDNDKKRKISPLKASNDAYLIKTDNLTIDQSFNKVMEIINRKL